jgi:hypothetical protein
MASALNTVEHLVENVNQTARESENLSNIVRVEEELDDAPPMLKLLVPGMLLSRLLLESPTPIY